ncbi:MAG TPA: right-handed parallel beta-helix repeat-containing protein [Blastocatellia bacterium]|nr:right-handed parallel beta-helix repeat-containing protein [Blastocatellia bacterium]
MNDLPRQKLIEIIARHGRSVAVEPRRCEGLLRDYCAAYRREIAVLVSAAEERVAADLLTVDTGLPREALLARLARRLHDNVAMEATAAKWAVNSWALALGVISGAELTAMEEGRPDPAPMAAAALAAAGARRQQVSTDSLPVIIVSASGDGDYKSLGEALKAAAPGSRLLVRPGLYREGVVINDPVEIIGDGRQEEIIIASAGASCFLMRADEATVRGLTLRQGAGSGPGGEGFFAVDIPQGHLTLEFCDISSRSLSCVGIHNDLTNPLIRRCRIHSSADSGVYIFNAAGGTIEDCDIHQNSNVGVAITERANPTIRSCAIRSGENAGVVSWGGGLGVVEECEIFSNAKAGVGISEEGNLTIRRSRIHGGGNSGVFVHHNGQGTLEECDIYGHAEPEVAVSLGGKLVARGCNVHEGKSSGVFVGDAGRVLMEQCDIYSNADAGINVSAGGGVALRQCRLNRNGSVAVRVQAGGTADAEGCDLTGNRIAPWQSEEGAVVGSRRNRV